MQRLHIFQDGSNDFPCYIGTIPSESHKRIIADMGQNSYGLLLYVGIQHIAMLRQLTCRGAPFQILQYGTKRKKLWNIRYRSGD